MQAGVENDNRFMKILKGFSIGVKDPKTIKLNKTLYGQKQAGRVWYKHFVKKLLSIGSQHSEIDECIFNKGNTIYSALSYLSLLSQVRMSKRES